MSNIAFLIHGKIKNKLRVSESIRQHFGSAHNLKFFFSERNEHFIQLAGDAIKEEFTHVICVGGDGSLNEVANGLMQAKSELDNATWGKIRMGVLPMGTGNDFVKTVNAPANIEGLKKVIEADNFKTIDLGLVNYSTKSGEKQSRYFINITDVGMGGIAAEKLSTVSKWMGSTLTYQRVIVSTLISYKNQHVRAKADTFSFEGKIMNFIIANGKYFGSGLGIAPDAVADDGIFSIVILGEISLLDYIKNLGNVSKCKKIVHPELHYHTAKEIKIDSDSGPLAIDMDGEFIGYSPMTVSMTHAALKFLCA